MKKQITVGMWEHLLEGKILKLKFYIEFTSQYNDKINLSIITEQ